MSYLRREPLDETNFPLFAAFRTELGFVPNFFRAQTMRPDLVEAEGALVNAILIKQGALTRKEKEYIFLVTSGANLNTYCVTAHCEIVRMLGIEGPEPELLAVDYTAADIPVKMKALLNFATKLNSSPLKVAERDIEALRTYGYEDQQIMEAIVIVGLAKFTNTVSVGLGAAPDFDSSRIAFRKTDPEQAGTVHF